MNLKMLIRKIYKSHNHSDLAFFRKVFERVNFLNDRLDTREFGFCLNEYVAFYRKHYVGFCERKAKRIFIRYIAYRISIHAYLIQEQNTKPNECPSLTGISDEYIKFVKFIFNRMGYSEFEYHYAMKYVLHYDGYDKNLMS